MGSIDIPTFLRDKSKQSQTTEIEGNVIDVPDFLKKEAEPTHLTSSATPSQSPSKGIIIPPPIIPKGEGINEPVSTQVVQPKITASYNDYIMHHEQRDAKREESKQKAVDKAAKNILKTKGIIKPGDENKALDVHQFAELSNEKSRLEESLKNKDALITYKDGEPELIEKGEPNVGGYIWNKVTDAVGGMSNAAGDLVFQLMSKIPAIRGDATEEETMKLYREEMSPTIRTGVTKLLGSDVPKEREKDYNGQFLTSAVGSIASMIPPIASPKGVGFILQAFDGGLQSINSSEAGSKLPESQKTIFATGVGIATGLLMKVGVDKIFGKQTDKIASGLTANVMADLVKNSTKPITAEAFEVAMQTAVKNLKNKVIAAGGKIGESAIAGGLFGTAMEATTIAAEEITNKATGQQVFEPTTWGEKFGRVLHAGSEMATVGGLLGGIHIPFSKTRDYIKEKVGEAKTPEDIQALKDELISKVQDKVGGEESAQQINDLVDKYVEVYNKIPPEANNKTEIVDNIQERDDLAKTIDEKQQQLQVVDPAFHEPIIQEINAANGRVDEINKEIANKAQEPQKPEEQPQPEVKSQEITFENAKEGDVINHNGESVTIVSKGKSRGGNDIVTVKKEPLKKTEKELEMDAANTVYGRHSSEYGVKGATVEDIKKNHWGEFNNALNDARKVQESQKPSEYTLDKEQWDNEVKSEPKPQPEVIEPSTEVKSGVLKDAYSTFDALNEYYKEAGFDAVDKLRTISKTSGGLTEIAEAYHKAKADGSNPELVKAIEKALTPKTSEKPITVVGDTEILSTLEKAKQAVKAKQKPVILGEVSESEYNDFIDKNVVSDERLSDIAGKVKNQQQLSEKENAIFTGKTAEINKIISESKPQPEVIEPSTELKNEELKPFAPEGEEKWLTPNKIEHTNKEGVTFKIGDEVNEDGKSLGKITGFNEGYAYTEKQNESADKRPINTEVLTKSEPKQPSTEVKSEEVKDIIEALDKVEKDNPSKINELNNLGFDFTDNKSIAEAYHEAKLLVDDVRDAEQRKLVKAIEETILPKSEPKPIQQPSTEVKSEEKGVKVGEEMAGEKLPTVDEVYKILENEEGRQGGSWLDNEYGDARFESEEQARAYAQEVHDFLVSLGNEKEIPVYRAVSAGDVDLTPYGIGESWSFDLDAAKEFGRKLGVPTSKVKIISGKVPSENVDWEAAVRAYHNFSDIASAESEFELPIPSNRAIHNIEVQDFKTAKEIKSEPQPSTVKSEEVKTNDEIRNEAYLKLAGNKELTIEQKKTAIELNRRKELQEDAVFMKGREKSQIENSARIINEKYDKQISDLENKPIQNEQAKESKVPDTKKQPKPEAKKDIGTKARELASKLESGEKSVLPSWMKAKLPPGTKLSGIDIDKAYANALRTFADIHDATKNFAKAIEEGFKHIKEWFKENNIDIDEAEMKANFENEVVGKGDIGITHAQTKEIREEQGFDLYEKDPKKVAEWDAEAKKRIKEGKLPDLISKMERGEDISAVEQRMMGFHIANLNAEVAKNPSNENISALRHAVELSDIVGGRQAGQALVARKGTFLPDNSLGSWMIQKMESLGVDELTPKQKEEIQKQFDEYDAKAKKADELLAKANEEIARLKAENELFKTKKEARKRDQATLKVERNDILTSIKEKWKGAGKETLSVSVPYAQQLIAIAPDVAKLTKNLVDSGVIKLADVIDNIHDVLKTIEPSIKKEDVRDLIAGVYNEPKPPKSALERALRDVRDEAKLIKRLEDLTSGVKVSEKKQIERNQEITELKRKIKEFKAENPDLEGQLKNIKKRNEAAEKILLERIKNKDFETKKPIPFDENAALKKANPKLYKETMDAIVAKDEARHKFDLAKRQDELDKRSKIRKVFDFGGKLISTSKAIKAGIDDSVTFVQLGMAVLANPKSGIKAKIEAIKDINNNRFKRQLAALHNSSNWDTIKNSGLDITEPKSLTKENVEELYSGNLLDQPIKGVNLWTYSGGIFERLFTSMGNNMRLNLFNKRMEYLENQGKTFESHPQEYKDAARVINELTGRGKVQPNLQAAMPVISPIIWAPKMLSSSLNLLGITDLAALPTGRKGLYRSITPQQRAYALTQMGKGIGMGVAVMGALSMAGWTVDYDPRSSTFGTVKHGTTTYNVFGRYAGIVKTLVQIITGKKETAFGETDLDEKGGRGTILGKFTRGKMTPASGIAYDYVFNSQKNTFTKEPINIKTLPNELLTPISVNDVKKGFEQDGSMSLLTRWLPAVEGIQVMDDRDFKNTHLFTKEEIDSKEFKPLKDKGIDLPSMGTVKTHKIDVDNKHPNQAKEGEEPYGLMTDEEFKQYNDTKKKYLIKEIKTILETKYPHREIYQSGLDKDIEKVLGKDLPTGILKGKIQAASTDISKRVLDIMFPTPEGKVKHEYKSEEEREKEKIELEKQLENN